MAYKTKYQNLTDTIFDQYGRPVGKNKRPKSKKSCCFCFTSILTTCILLSLFYFIFYNRMTSEITISNQLANEKLQKEIEFGVKNYHTPINPKFDLRQLKNKEVLDETNVKNEEKNSERHLKSEENIEKYVPYQQIVQQFINKNKLDLKSPFKEEGDNEDDDNEKDPKEYDYNQYDEETTTMKILK